ncbi:hypothetical protein K488DRAFT_86648 [Vararia minispora EC-137]|uniref:Uncharacterized protein n=1 Tax=Vararia minispora EC-137 TaxID=1314806 RepID=A0ACB8QIU9_9AGAM|nr:hypothetical protein K488DRAFT_86648 [Vararia minispora EC-137]
MENHNNTNDFDLFTEWKTSQDQSRPRLALQGGSAHIPSGTSSFVQGNSSFIMNDAGTPSTSAYAPQAVYATANARRAPQPLYNQPFSSSSNNHPFVFGSSLPSPFTFAPTHPARPVSSNPGSSALPSDPSLSHWSPPAYTPFNDNHNAGLRAPGFWADFDTMFAEDLQRMTPAEPTPTLHGHPQTQAGPSRTTQGPPSRIGQGSQSAHVSSQLPTPEDSEDNRGLASVWQSPLEFTWDSRSAGITPVASSTGSMSLRDGFSFPSSSSSWAPFAGAQRPRIDVSAVAPVAEQTAPANALPTYTERGAGPSRDAPSFASTVDESQPHIPSDPGHSRRPPHRPVPSQGHPSSGVASHSLPIASSSRKRLHEEDESEGDDDAEDESGTEEESDTDSLPSRPPTPVYTSSLCRRRRYLPREWNFIPVARVRSAGLEEDLSQYRIALSEAYHAPNYTRGKNHGRARKLDPEIACPAQECGAGFSDVPSARRHFCGQMGHEIREGQSVEMRPHTMWLANTIHETAEARGAHEHFRIRVLSRPAYVACSYCGKVFSRSDSCYRHERENCKKRLEHLEKGKEKEDGGEDGGRKKKRKVERS